MPLKGAISWQTTLIVGAILVVDDNPRIRELAKLFLENAGYAVAVACDGAEALRFYEQHQSRVMLLITDVTMPNMNGLELSGRVGGIDPQLPVLIMSGESRDAYPGLESIAKPFRPHELLERVSRAVKAHGNPERIASVA